MNGENAAETVIHNALLSGGMKRSFSPSGGSPQGCNEVQQLVMSMLQINIFKTSLNVVQADIKDTPLLK